MNRRLRGASFVALAAAFTAVSISCVGEDPTLMLADADEKDATTSDVVPSTPDSSAENAADAATDAAPLSDAGCGGAANCERVIFATQELKTGNLAGAAGADAFCTAEANAAGAHARVRGREYVAWLSFVNASAAVRHVHGAQRYVRPDGVQIAVDWAALSSGTLEVNVGLDQYGAVATGTIWTGTQADGTRASFNCVDFGSSQEVDVGGGGSLAATGSTWTESASFKCNSAHRLLCIER